MDPFFWDAYDDTLGSVTIALGHNSDDDAVTTTLGPVFRRRGDESCVYVEISGKHRHTDPPRLGFIMYCHVLRRIIGPNGAPVLQPPLYRSLDERAIIKVFAFEKVQANFACQESPFREIEALRMIQEPGRHVVTVDAVLQDKDGNLGVVMPLPPGDGSSLDHILSCHGPLLVRQDGETYCRDLFRQLIYGLEYIHSVGLHHRDICCENFVVSTTTTNDETRRTVLYGYIIDFGLALRVPRDANGTVRPVASNRLCPGKRNYQSPEAHDPDQFTEYNAEKADVWSCGIVLLNMLNGYLYCGSTLENVQAMRRIFGPTEICQHLDYLLRGTVELPSVPTLAADLLRNMLHPDADKRFLIAQIQNHSWLTNP